MIAEKTLPEILPDEPLGLLETWLRYATDRHSGPNPLKMALATANTDTGLPSVRMVLAKSLVTDPGYLVFYTNYRSRKARELDGNTLAEGMFHWDELGLQVRVSGPVVRSPDEESDRYFASRDRTSQLSAWASEQSEPVTSRGALIERLERAKQRFADNTVPRPDFWGGYRLWFASVELWTSAEGRLHDRAIWTRSLAPEGDGFDADPWKATRLQP
ncbi:MAG: pyridoxamine 5'-phosphate oxidase [Gammaproteobacteria bacterium]